MAIKLTHTKSKINSLSDTLPDTHLGVWSYRFFLEVFRKVRVLQADIFLNMKLNSASNKNERVKKPSHENHKKGCNLS